MIRYGTQKDVDEYFASDRQSQSLLKEVIKGIELYNIAISEQRSNGDKRLYYQEKGHYVVGSAVDVYMTQGQTAFKEQFYLSTVVKPSDLVMSIVQHVYDNVHISDDMVFGELTDFILEACNYHIYQKNWKDETRVADVIKKGSDYFQSLIESQGKQSLSSEEGDIVNGIIMSFKTHNHTRDIFSSQQPNHIDIFYQVPIYFELDGVECKALLDMVKVDHLEKSIQVNDIKTMSGYVINFKSSFESLRYDIQGAFYNTAIGLLKYGKATSPVLEAIALQQYTIKPFRFIVESTVRPGIPLVYQMSSYYQERGRIGRPALIVEGRDENEGSSHPIEFKKIDGYEQALEKIIWHRENGFTVERRVAEQNGILIL